VSPPARSTLAGASRSSMSRSRRSTGSAGWTHVTITREPSASGRGSTSPTFPGAPRPAHSERIGMSPLPLLGRPDSASDCQGGICDEGDSFVLALGNARVSGQFRESLEGVRFPSPATDVFRKILFTPNASYRYRRARDTLRLDHRAARLKAGPSLSTSYVPESRKAAWQTRYPPWPTALKPCRWRSSLPKY
jgi:hypothetical protein